VAADRQVPERAERYEVIDHRDQWLDVMPCATLDHDLRWERSPQHADCVALGASVRAGRELILGVHVELGGGPRFAGTAIPDEDTAALLDRAERLPTGIV